MNWYRVEKTSQRANRGVTQTPAFRSWFGRSQVVDQNGEPLIVYKGMWGYDYTKENRETGDPGPPIEHIQSPGTFPSFDPSDQEPVRVAGFFTDDPKVAQTFMFGRGAMFATYLRIEKPAVFDAQGKPAGTIQFGKEGRPFRDAIRSGQYDGVFIRNTSDEANIYIPLSSVQIKSAISNTTFNPNDPRLVA